MMDIARYIFVKCVVRHIALGTKMIFPLWTAVYWGPGSSVVTDEIMTAFSSVTLGDMYLYQKYNNIKIKWKKLFRCYYTPKTKYCESYVDYNCNLIHA